MQKHKIIIDTDIGDDADDALAITLACKSPELDILGITTVFRNTAARAKITVKLLGLLGRSDIPVYAGIGQPLVKRVDVDEIPTQLLPGMESLAYQDKTHAVDFIIDTLMASSGDVTLVPIGALTNIAVAMLKCPEIKGKIKEIVMMGGAFYTHYNEWNIVCDPEAADVVFRSGVRIRAVGLDVTTCCPVTEEVFQQVKAIGKPYSDLLCELMLVYKIVRKKGRYPFLHDPLAIFAVYDGDGLLSYRQEKVSVELTGTHTRATTFITHGLGSENVEAVDTGVFCASYVDAEAFTRKYVEIISR